MAASYNPKTGISSFKQADPADEATVAAPSTATSFSAPTGPGLFSPVNPQVHPRDDFFGFQYDYSPEELAGLGYQYVPESTTSGFRRVNDDRERFEQTIPGHFIDPTRFAPMRRPGDDSGLPDWMFSQSVRNGDDRDIVRNPLVVDPFRSISPGSLSELQQYGLWQNVSDPNAPLYDTLRAKGVATTPDQMAKVLLQLSGLGLTSTPEQWQAALGDMQISPELAGAIRQRLEDLAREQAEGSGGLFGGGGFLGTGIGTGNPALDQMLSFGQGAMMGGNIGGTVATGNFDSAALKDAALQDAVTLGSAALGPTISGLTGGGMFGAIAGGAAGGGLNALVHGEDTEDVLQGALAGAATAGGLRLGGQALAHFFPAETPPAPSTSTSLADAGFDPMERQFPGPDLSGMLPLAQADTGTMTDASSPLMRMLEPQASQVPGAMVDFATGAPATLSGVQTGSAIPAQFDGSLESLMSASGLSVPAPDILNGPGPSEQPKPPTPEEQRVQQATKTIERLAKIGSALAKMHDGQGVPAGAPRREEGQSDDEYSQQLTQYAAAVDPALAESLNPEAIAGLGFTPGSPEYVDYVLQRLDAVLDQLLAGVDADSKSLEQQLRSKTREEINELQRVLYLRGQLGQLMQSGTYLDPFTGREQVIRSSNVNPAKAAYSQGLAASGYQLARMSPVEGRQFVGDWISRDPDLYGRQAAQDARALQETLAAQSLYRFDDDLKRRRSEMAMSPDAWREILDQMSPEQLRALLVTFGDDDRGIAALGQLVG